MRYPILFLVPALVALSPLPAPTAPGSRCTSPGRIVSRRATAPDRIDLTMVGGRTERVTLVEACPHLAELDRTYTLVLDQRDGDTLCAGDRFRLVDPLVARAGGVASYPFCRIASIEPAAAGR